MSRFLYPFPVRFVAALLAVATWLGASAGATEPKPSGILKVAGADLHGLLKSWADGFERKNPDVHVVIDPDGSDAAIGSIEQSTAQIAVLGRELELSEYLGFYETWGYNPTEITVASGTLETPGATWAPVVFVNRDNPIKGLTLAELDCIFGAARTGAYVGFEWHPELARSADKDLRDWGQLGLDDWAGKPITTYGYASGGMAHFFESVVFNGGTKWAESYHEYVENGTKILRPGQESSGILAMFADLGRDRYGIGWAGIPQLRKASDPAGVRIVPIARTAGEKYIAPTPETVANRTYPLTRSIYFVLARAPGTAVSPAAKAFVEYVLGPDGQAAVTQQAVYFALPEPLRGKEAAKVK